MRTMQTTGENLGMLVGAMKEFAFHASEMVENTTKLEMEDALFGGPHVGKLRRGCQHEQDLAISTR